MTRHNFSLLKGNYNGADCFTRDDTGESGMSLRGVASLCGVTEKELVSLLNDCDAGKYASKRLEIMGEWRFLPCCNLDAVTDNAIALLLGHFAFVCCNPVAIMNKANIAFPHSPISLTDAQDIAANLLRIRAKRDKKRKPGNIKSLRQTKERIIQLRIQLETDGKIEVKTPAGRIDILTATHIIEIKVADKWKDGIGQLLSYRCHYPEHLMRLHLFGELSNLSDVKFICTNLSIELTTEE
ncbi:MAG: hypothetical protein LRZ84_14320 [Desertifilum sp.]|nr:hypothetical protein [Desertifilum sp.]